MTVVIIGAGAAGLATAIFAKRANPTLSVIVLEGAERPGAKILVSGGSRCNVTNAVVTERDFFGGKPTIVRQVLRAWSAADTIGLFTGLGVPLREEPLGKMFPESGRSRDVLGALLTEVARLGVDLRSGHRVTDVRPEATGFAIDTARGAVTAGAVVLATGGLALPKSGSDGAGYAFAESLGHTIVPTTPALVPLVLSARGEDDSRRTLSGVSQPVELELRDDARVTERVRGALLWTHFGVSGPAVLDVSRHWLRLRLDGRSPTLTANLAGGRPYAAIDAAWTELAFAHPRLGLGGALARFVPASVASVLARSLGLEATVQVGNLPRASRRALVRALTEWPLPVIDSRGYTYAEATAGGVALAEIDPSTMASRRCPGLYLVGEVLDVDGRLGGFNFQWAWASAFVAGSALARRG